MDIKTVRNNYQKQIEDLEKKRDRELHMLRVGDAKKVINGIQKAFEGECYILVRSYGTWVKRIAKVELINGGITFIIQSQTLTDKIPDYMEAIIDYEEFLPDDLPKNLEGIIHYISNEFVDNGLQLISKAEYSKKLKDKSGIVIPDLKWNK